MKVLQENGLKAFMQSILNKFIKKEDTEQVTTVDVDTTPTNNSNHLITSGAVAGALATKLTEPSSDLAVGKYFRIASIDENGHAVLECVDPPTSPVKGLKMDNQYTCPIDEDGNLRIDFINTFHIFMLSGIPSITLADPSNSVIDRRLNYRGITSKTYDYAVKCAMTDGVGAAWTDTEKNGCYDRTTIRKTSLDNVLVPNANYDLGSTEQASVTLTLPTPSGTDNYSCNEIYVAFTSGSTPTALSIVGTYVGDTSYLPSANSICELSFKYVCGTWVLVAKDTALSSV